MPLPPVGWTSHELMRTEARSWSETGELSGSIRFDAGSDIAGPFTIGVALTRNMPTIDDDKRTTVNSQQRIIVIGDGDFLSNAYLGNGGNLAMGMNIVNWLAHDDIFIDIPVKVAPDRNLELSPIAQGIIGLGFLFIIPLVLAGSGFLIWLRRRKR